MDEWVERDIMGLWGYEIMFLRGGGKKGRGKEFREIGWEKAFFLFFFGIDGYNLMYLGILHVKFILYEYEKDE